MDTLNITIDGHLGMPGLSRVRVPPPFGTSRDVIRAIESRRAQALSEEVLGALAIGNQAVARGRRRHPRLTVIGVGMACTVAAALMGSHTGQRRQPLPKLEPIASIAREAPAAVAPVESLDEASIAPHISSGAVVPAQAEEPTDAAVGNGASVPLAMAETPAPVAAPAVEVPAVEPVAPPRAPPAAKPRTLVKSVGRSTPRTATRNVAKPAQATPMDAEETPTRYTHVASTATYVPPSGPAVTIELQRHTRLTD